MVVYEQALSEKIRLFIRMEHLVQRFNLYKDNADYASSHAALEVLQNLYNMSSRLDVKSSILNIMDWQTMTLRKMLELEQIDKQMMENSLASLDRSGKRLYDFRGQLGQHLKQNDFFSYLLQRNTVPGALNQLDVPIFNYWLNKPKDQRKADLDEWVEPYMMAYESVEMVMQLIRESQSPVDCVAENGYMEYSIPSAQDAQLLRLELDEADQCFPEISAGRQRFSIRLLDGTDLSQKCRQVTRDIHFRLTVCHL